MSQFPFNEHFTTWKEIIYWSKYYLLCLEIMFEITHRHAHLAYYYIYHLANSFCSFFPLSLHSAIEIPFWRYDDAFEMKNYYWKWFRFCVWYSVESILHIKRSKLTYFFRFLLLYPIHCSQMNQMNADHQVN